MGDAAARVKNLSDDYKGMSAAMQGVGAGVGAFTAVSGAMSMLGQDSEKVNEAIKNDVVTWYPPGRYGGSKST
jgi:hypothetical protein